MPEDPPATVAGGGGCSGYAEDAGSWALAGLLAGAVWLVLWLLLDDHALPGGPVFPVWLIFVTSVVAGRAVTRLRFGGTSAPDLLGMMLAGFLLRNTGAADGLRDGWSAAIRQLALAVILMRAGLGLDLAKLRALGRPTVLLSFVPCTVEAGGVAVVSRLLLDPAPPWTWTLMLGFVVAAVSPAVVVPSLKQLQDDGYGVAKGVPTMVLCAAGLDDVVAVTGYGVFLGIAFSSASLALAIAHGPIDLGIGIGGGLAAGAALGQLRRAGSLPPSRYAAALLCCGAAAVLGFGRVGHSGGGCLLAMCAAFVAKQLWAPERVREADALLKQLWDGVAKALLFGCIGAAVDVDFLDGSLVGGAVGTVACGLAVRLPVSFLATLGSPLTARERLFVTLAWLPKATVQAALGPVALDRARARDPIDPLEVRWGEQVLCVSALAILLTAPAGAVLIAITGPRWLSRGDAPPQGAEGAPAAPRESPPRRLSPSHRFVAPAKERDGDGDEPVIELEEGAVTGSPHPT